jgi:hypothetical protein
MTQLDAIERGTAELEHVFDVALNAALPNPVALIFSDLPLAYQGKRDLIFALDLFNEGENECALICGFARNRLRDDANADIAHLEREGWYYLRTSIDPTWQFDEGMPSLPAALAYLAHVLTERTAGALAAPRLRNPDAATTAQRAELLRRMRSDTRT